jgi:predicted nuclease of predicted toxin-antitoxin system
VRARFLADADLDRRIVTSLQKLEPDIDFETAQAAALKGLPDSEVLRIAAEKNRVLVSHDRSTMPRAFYKFVQERESPGLILVRQIAPFRQVLEDLRIYYHALLAQDFVNGIYYAPL